MNLNYVRAENSDKRFFWDNYCQSMQPHIEEIWGWDEEWQLVDFEKRWVDCENSLIRIDEQTVGYMQTQEFADEHYIMMLILLPEYRSAGIGGKILTQEIVGVR
ncbi:GNAT family N-acetyltransferase [Simiduia aestuariiviva]|uniref:Ribosomal protein S18 acetylase RimI-like enzyme n=1 Tax=Simiduia aestuariiviva TaxID=1510459 RepID=A0A839UGS5_9GAMM|nr:GNAT family N-acetyltransferase [Simiduia aestuariiviva]MBB3167082.1 ribosomal protein S18 acetylase RimI-like enzyme [Simiduia aestuariiviva]